MADSEQPKIETPGHPEDSRKLEEKPRVRIETDESGFIKAVTYKGQILPVESITIYADAKLPLATAELTLHVDASMTAVAGGVTLRCPICFNNFDKHFCYDNPSDEDDFH